jgi:uncharacterized protein (TIGR02466 family)
MQVEGWFPTPIGFEDLPEAAEFARSVGPLLRRVAEIQGNPQPQVLGTATTGANAPDITQYLFLLDPLRPLFDAILRHVTAFLDANGVDRTREHVTLGRAWVNRLDRGARIERHHHVAALVSGVCYVDAPATGTSLRFLDPRAPHVRDPQFAHATPFNQRTVAYPVRPGRLLLFPGWLEHGMATPHEDDTPRLSVAFDIYATSLSGTSPPPTPPEVAEPLWRALRAQGASLLHAAAAEPAAPTRTTG